MHILIIKNHIFIKCYQKIEASGLLKILDQKSPGGNLNHYFSKKVSKILLHISTIIHKQDFEEMVNIGGKEKELSSYFHV